RQDVRLQRECVAAAGDGDVAHHGLGEHALHVPLVAGKLDQRVRPLSARRVVYEDGRVTVAYEENAVGGSRLAEIREGAVRRIAPAQTERRLRLDRRRGEGEGAVEGARRRDQHRLRGRGAALARAFGVDVVDCVWPSRRG